MEQYFPLSAAAEESDKLCRALKQLAKRKLQRRDAVTVRAAIEYLTLFPKIKAEMRALGLELISLDDEYAADAARFPDHAGQLQLAAGTMSLQAVLKFIDPIPTRGLYLLRDALLELATGASPAAMFLPEPRSGGRRPDSHFVLAAKGTLAGMMQALQSAGMPRQQAAKWIATHTSPLLVSRISKKPLTSRVVEEWTERYGGEFGEHGVARERYLLWREHNPVDAKRWTEITGSIAIRMPARKPR